MIVKNEFFFSAESPASGTLSETVKRSEGQTQTVKRKKTE